MTLVVIIEFSDYQCGHCRHMSSVVQEVAQKFPSVQVVVRELPIFGKESEFAAKVAMIAAKEGKFSAVHHALMKAKDLNKESVIKLAEANHIDREALNKALKDNDALDAEIRENVRLSQQLQIMGTPAFIVADVQGKSIEFVPGAMPKERLVSLIKKVLYG